MYDLTPVAVTESCVHMALGIPVYDTRVMAESQEYGATIQLTVAVN